MISDKDLVKMAQMIDSEKRRIQRMRFGTARLVDDVVIFEKMPATAEVRAA